MRIKILAPGKTKEPWLIEGLKEYQKRLPTVSFEWVHPKNSDELLRLAKKEKSLIALDPKGKYHSSESFADWFFQQLEASGSRLTFVIGDCEGLPSLPPCPFISLSPLTFTHQMTRLILVEQIYRAFQIHQGSGNYHK